MKCLLLSHTHTHGHTHTHTHTHTMRTLTNNTEIVNWICKLGCGTSYVVIEKLDTENAYNMTEKQPQN